MSCRLEPWDVQRIEDVCHGVRAKWPLALAHTMSEQLLELRLFEQLLQSIETRHSKHRGVEQRVDHGECRDRRVAPSVTKLFECLGDSVDADGVLLELVESLLLLRSWFEVVHKAQLGRRQLLGWLTCSKDRFAADKG